MITNQRKPSWFFYPAWVVLNTLCIPMAGTISWIIVSQVEKVVGGTIQVGGQTVITEDYLTTYILLIVLGVLAGSLQFLLLRNYLPRLGWWIPMTSIGLLLGLVASRLLFRTLFNTLDSTWFEILMTVLVGGSVGLIQWLMLRQRVRHAGWWILANAFGWGLVGWGAATISNQILLPIVGILLAPGVATSVALWLLLDKLPRQESSGRTPPTNKSLQLT